MSGPSRGTRYLLASLFLLGGFLAPASTLAQCAPDPASPGGTVTCAGTDPDGFTSNFDDLTINVTGTVNSAGPNQFAFDLFGTGNRVELSGSANITPAIAGVGIRFRADDGVAIIGSGTSINVDTFTAGVVLEANNAQITIDGAITGANLFGHGVLTFNTDGTQVTVGPTGSVITTGDDSRGIDLQASNSSITVAGIVTTSGGQTTGDAAHALIVGDNAFNSTGGMINLLPTAQVSTSGEGAGVVLASGAGPTVVVAEGASVMASGEMGGINGFPSFGIGMDAIAGVAQNNGNVSADPNTGSIAAVIAGNDSVFNNNATGVLTGGGAAGPLQAAFGFAGSAGTGGTLNNSGTITGAVLVFDTANAVVNNLAGVITGPILLGGGDDAVDVQSTVGGDIALDDGSDLLTISSFELVGGALDGGDDVATGDGFVDVLRVQGGAGSFGVDELANWEVIELAGAAVLSLDTPLFAVGGAGGTDPGSGLPFGLNIAGASSLLVLQSMVLQGNALNSGEISLAADAVTGTALELAGDYAGDGALLTLDVVLGDDISPGDLIIVPDGATVTGDTALQILNLGGLGDVTTGDGILLVETRDSGSTTADAFTLRFPVRVGEYEYGLFYGGLADPGDGNWYLRSTLVRPVPLLPPVGILAIIVLLGIVGGLRLRARR